MSADITKDVSLIQDEDALRKMWQETEDFGRKKEIRSHMYKLREQRLRDFYNNGEINTEIRTSITGKSCDTPTHADSLADHSFLSLKTKEIRDSESPTRDLHYKVSERQNDQGWQVSTSNKTSTDGKTYTATQVATKSSTKNVDGSKIDYMAKNKQIATVYQDGDDANFTKSIGAQSNTVVKQEAKGGKENNNFKSSLTKKTSSSRIVTEQRSTSGESSVGAPRSIDTSLNVVPKNIYTDEVPLEIKNNPNYMEGKTKVTREAKTLPDGTTVTTTHYEIEEGTSSKLEAISKFSTNISRSAQKSTTSKTSTFESSNSIIKNQSDLYDNTRAIVEYIPDSYETIGLVTHHSKIYDDKHTHTDSQTENFSTHVEEKDCIDKRNESNVSFIKDKKNTKQTTKHEINKNISQNINRTQNFQNGDLSVNNINTPVENVIDNKIIDIIPSRHQDSKYSVTTVTKRTTTTSEPAEQVSTDSTSTIQNNETINNRFVNIERQHEQDTENIKFVDYRHSLQPQYIKPEDTVSVIQKPQSDKKKEKYQQPEKRQPFKPGKSELDQPINPTEAQYDTTYKTDYTQKKISVEVSPTHDAFARSLRSVTPERIFNKNNLKTSNNSLRNSISPDKLKPYGSSPHRHSRSSSPRKSADRFSSSETITYSNRSSLEKRLPTKSPSPQRVVTSNIMSKAINNDEFNRKISVNARSSDTTTTSKKNINNRAVDIDNNSLIRCKNQPQSRSPSQICTNASDIEFIRNTNDVTTDLDEECENFVSVTKTATHLHEISKNNRPSSLEITNKKTRKVIDRSPTSPLFDLVSPSKKSPIKELLRSGSLRSPTKESPNNKPKLKRTDTYEERCRQILGLTETNEKRRSSLERNSLRCSSLRDNSKITITDTRQLSKSPEKTQDARKSISPTQETFVSSQIIKYQNKELLETCNDKKKLNEESEKQISQINEFASQMRKSPEKAASKSYIKKKRPTTQTQISEFSSQIKRSPERKILEPYPEKKCSIVEASGISEFPSQIKKSPERERLEPYPEKKRPMTQQPQLSEFPSQIRKSSKREPLEPYLEKKRPMIQQSLLSEFPSQIKKKSEGEPLESHVEKKPPMTKESQLSEFPSQFRKSLERELLEPYPEKKRPMTQQRQLSEFPSQIRKSPEHEPLEPYPMTQPPQLSEIRSQNKKSPERESLGPDLSEFPSQVRKSPELEPLKLYSEKKHLTTEKRPIIKEISQISEFPSQLKSPERDPSAQYPEKEGFLNLMNVYSTAQITADSVQKIKSSKKTKMDSKLSTNQPLVSNSSDEEETEEVFTETLSNQVENYIPIKEPEVTMKFINQLCREEEIERNNNTKDTKGTKDILRKEINLTRKKDQTSIQNNSRNFIDKETNISKKYTKDTNKKSIKSFSDTSKISSSTILINKHSKSPTRKVNKTDKTKFTEQIECADKHSKIKRKPCTPKHSNKINILDIKQLNVTEDNNTVRIRTHRIDDTVNKKSTTPKIFNGDVLKKNKPIDSSQSPVSKCTTTKTTVITTPILPIKKISPTKTKKSQTTTNSTRYVTTAKKNVNLLEATVKNTINLQDISKKAKISDIFNKTTKSDLFISKFTKSKDSIAMKPLVTTTIIVTPKSGKTKITKATITKSTKVISDSTNKPNKLPNDRTPDTEDDESVIDSLNGSTIDLTKEKLSTNNVNESTNKKTFNADKLLRPTMKTIINKSASKKQSNVSKSKKPEQRCITTKTVIINNKNQNQEIIVDLQRSKSSREPTPDRLCPVPLSSDEEQSGIPRYPDLVSEPDDGIFKRKPKRLSDIPILETENSSEFNKVVDITDCNKFKKTDIDIKVISKKQQDTEKSKLDQPTYKIIPSEDEPDECLLSVSDKVTKFISTAESLVTPQQFPERPKSPRCQNYRTNKISEKISHFTSSFDKSATPIQGLAPKVLRPDLTYVDESIKDDECLLSVSDKVSKFVSTPDRLVNTENQTISLSGINVESKEEIISSLDRKSPEKLILDSKTSCDRKSPNRLSPERNTPDRKWPEIERFSPTCKSPTRSEKTTIVTINAEDNIFTRKSSLEKPFTNPIEETPDTSNKFSGLKSDIKLPLRDASSKFADTPKGTRRFSQGDSKICLSSTDRLRSTENINKAKALFEIINKEQETLKQEDIVSRPSVFDGRKPKTDLEEKHVPTISSKTIDKTFAKENNELKSTKILMDTSILKSSSPERIVPRTNNDIPHYMSPLDRIVKPEREGSRSPERIHEASIHRPKSSSPGREDIPHYMLPLDRIIKPEHIFQKFSDKSPESPLIRTRESSVDREDVPHYMLPLDRSLRPHSPHRDSMKQSQITYSHSPSPDSMKSKFGVTLRKTNSEKLSVITNTAVTNERKNGSMVSENCITEEEIDGIFDLEVLEELLIKVVGYELRRKLRTQIRLVKQLKSEGTLQNYILQRKTVSKDKQLKSNDSIVKRNIENQLHYTRNASPEKVTEDGTSYERTYNPETKKLRKSIERTTEYLSSYSYNERRSSSDCVSTVIERKRSPELKISTRTSPVKDKPRKSIPEKEFPLTSPDKKITSRTETREQFTKLRKTVPSRKTYEDDKPEWVKNRNLKKTSQTLAPVSKKTTKNTTTVTRKDNSRSSPIKEIKTTDLITSSYGVGPTDENGIPLFGLRALRAQNKTTKVEGTVITSEYHSETGKEPVGQISVTQYSTDPKDLTTNAPIVDNQGITNITTTQKFGYKDSPSLNTLTTKQKKITNEEESPSYTKSSKVTRRNSVKALSQKFVDNAVETSKSERQTSYPKAGLILRTSSFKDSNNEDDSKETSPAERECESVTIRSSSTTTSSGDTFFTNRSRVSGVKDVISRMKTEEYREGDTEDDANARNLLNKFIGSQVILSGMEAKISSNTTQETRSGSPTSSAKMTTKITTTITESEKPTTKTLIFQRPISQKELDTIWEEQTLRLLLEKSTDYEERRNIRARLRQVMAEQEACTELVEKASQEQSSGSLEERTVTTEKTISTGPITTKTATKITTQQQMSKKPLSPFAKFQQLEKQNSRSSPRTFN